MRKLIKYTFGLLVLIVLIISLVFAVSILPALSEKIKIFVSPVNHPDFCPVCGENLMNSACSVWEKNIEAMKCSNSNKYWVNSIDVMIKSKEDKKDLK